MMRIVLSLLVGLCLASAGSAATPEEKCESSKNKAAGDYASCRQKAEAKAITRAAAPDYSKCEAKFVKKWQKAEAKAVSKGAVCPSTGDETAMRSFVTGHSDTVAAALAGAGVPACGDGAANAVGEECDGADLRGKTCATLGSALGSLACDGFCQYDTSDCGCPGEQVGAFCFVLGAVEASCNEACTDLGLVYDDLGTRGFAGSDGTNTQCEVVLDLLGAAGAGTPANVSCVEGFGCAEALGARNRCLEPTTADAGFLVTTRVCACM